MPTSGELPDDPVPPNTSAIPPLRRRSPGESAQVALWHLYAYVQSLDPADPDAHRPDPVTMGAVVLAELMVAADRQRTLARLTRRAARLARAAARALAGPRGEKPPRECRQGLLRAVADVQALLATFGDRPRPDAGAPPPGAYWG